MQRHVSLPQTNKASVCILRQKERERAEVVQRRPAWVEQGAWRGTDTYYNGENTCVIGCQQQINNK